MRNLNLFIVLFAVIVAVAIVVVTAKSPQVYIPTLQGDGWRVCNLPDLGALNGEDIEKMHIVDHGFIQANNGAWQLWACMRGTKPGRILYKWEGERLEQTDWADGGVAARADTAWGEKAGEAELLQAPHFIKTDGLYWCIYNSSEVRAMFSEDGKNYERRRFHEGNNILTHANGVCKGRDPMVFQDDDGKWYLYTTVSYVTDGHPASEVIVRSSDNLAYWSDYTVVSRGGVAGNGPVSAESPFVVKYKGKYYLFRASSITFLTYVYCSDTPYNFGVDNDDKLIATLPLKAPEVFEYEGQWYISDLADFKGVKLYKIKWSRK